MSSTLFRNRGTGWNLQNQHTFSLCILVWWTNPRICQSQEVNKLRKITIVMFLCSNEWCWPKRLRKGFYLQVIFTPIQSKKARRIFFFPLFTDQRASHRKASLFTNFCRKVPHKYIFEPNIFPAFSNKRMKEIVQETCSVFCCVGGICHWKAQKHIHTYKNCWHWCCKNPQVMAGRKD